MTIHHLKLNISDLVIHMDLSRLENGVYSGLAEIFSPFIRDKGKFSHETIDVLPLRKEVRKSVDPGLEAIVRKSLEIPLSKFPFTTDLEREVEYLFKKVSPFFRDAGFKAFLEGLNDPGAILMYPFGKGCIIRRRDSATSHLFLRGRYWRRSKVGTIFGTTYLTTSLALPLVDSVMLHGVGIRRQGVGYLFLGLSGDGKSTLAGFSPPDEVISDDGIVLVGNVSNYYLDISPFDQLASYKRYLKISSAKRARLGVGFFLKKDSRVYLEKVPPSDACSMILKNHIHYFRYFPPDRVKKAFSLVTGLCRRIPFYNLHFKKDPSFWSRIEGELSNMI